MAMIGAALIAIGGFITGGALTGLAAGIVGAIAVIGAIAGVAGLFGGGGVSGDSSVTSSLSGTAYSFGQLVTQTNSSLSIPLIYGEFKLAGNIIWQDGSTTVKRLTSFSHGPISGFSDIRLNDIPVANVSGASCSVYTGTGTQTIDSRVTGTTQEEKAALVGGLRYEAYLAMTVTATEQVNTDFNITTLVKGRLISVYDAYLTTEAGDKLIFEDGSYMHVEEGNYDTIWSDNPAYCLLDLLTSYEGVNMDISEMDIPSFIDTARNCDGLVNGNKRFTLNLAIDTKKATLDWIAEICKCSQSIFGKRGDKWFLMADKAEDTTGVLTFTKDNINDMESYFLEMENTYDVVNANYKDKDYEWTYVQARAEASEFLRDDYPLIKTFDVLGCTNFDQASRLAWFYLNQAILTPMFISFKTSKRGLNLTVGDIITIDDYIYGFTGKFYRVLNLSEAQTSQIQIVAREYNASLYSDERGSADPTINFIYNQAGKIYLEDFSGRVLFEDATYITQQ
jgi:hypothetical protein